jgi:hypothetical protein
MARRQRTFEIRAPQHPRLLEPSARGAARTAARLARQGYEAEVIDSAYGWVAMTCRPERRGRRTVARCIIKPPFKRRLTFRGKPAGLSGGKRRRRRS